MTPDRLADIREASRLATLTPGAAVRLEAYDEHLHAIEAAPDYLAETLDLIDELSAELRLTKLRLADWHAIAAEMRERCDRLTLRVAANEGRKPQNDLLRDLWRRERQKRQMASVRIIYRETIEDFLGGLPGHTLEEVLMRTSDLEGAAR
jgi:hypothetical protein